MHIYVHILGFIVLLFGEFVTDGHVNRQAVFAVKCLSTDSAVVHKLSWKMNGLHMVFYVGFVFVFFSTTLATEQSRFSVSFNVLLQDNPICG